MADAKTATVGWRWWLRCRKRGCGAGRVGGDGRRATAAKRGRKTGQQARSLRSKTALALAGGDGELESQTAGAQTRLAYAARASKTDGRGRVMGRELLVSASTEWTKGDTLPGAYGRKRCRGRGEEGMRKRLLGGRPGGRLRAKGPWREPMGETFCEHGVGTGFGNTVHSSPRARRPGSIGAGAAWRARRCTDARLSLQLA